MRGGECHPSMNGELCRFRCGFDCRLCRLLCFFLGGELLFVVEPLASLLDENRLSIIARRYGTKKAKDSDSLGTLIAAYLRRAEESVLGSVLVETTILYMSTRHNPAQVLSEAATVYHTFGTDERVPSGPDRTHNHFHGVQRGFQRGTFER
jgi:hypothetical protein